jgi:hypothetical protein
MRYMLRLSIWLLLVCSVGRAVAVHAHEPVTCFGDVPGIGSCITDRFQEYWSQNGGLAVFGYPLTPAFEQRTPEGTFLVQYFERQRFELHPEKRRPYDVLLGRLGDELLRRNGRDWRGELANAYDPACWQAPQTGRSLCDPFTRFWNDHYLQGMSPTDGSLALLGLPLTDVKVERNPDGAQVKTQWLERARVEFHPNNPKEYQVLLGRLGAEALSGTTASVGGISNGHDAARRQIVVESQRDGSATTVRYTAATQLKCSGGGAASTATLARPELKLFADGVFDAQGVLSATTITMLCA